MSPWGWMTRPATATTRRPIAKVAGLILIQLVFLAAMRQRIGRERPTPADLLTGCRAACATAILSRAWVGHPERTPERVRRLVVLAALAATLTDWVDGPLARRFGPTRLGAVMDIEADSLLTLAMAVAAIRWGGLPLLALAPPIVRYYDLVRTLRRGVVFTGDNIWWCRASGAAQMLLLLLAVAPNRPRLAGRGLRRAAIAVSLAQLATQILDGRRRFGPLAASMQQQPVGAGSGAAMRRAQSPRGVAPPARL
jgi:phosphatidylglycerophosphate synthase